MHVCARVPLKEC